MDSKVWNSRFSKVSQTRYSIRDPCPNLGFHSGLIPTSISYSRIRKLNTFYICFYIFCHNFAHLAKGTRFSMKFSNPIPESTYYWVPVEILWNSWSRISGRIFTDSNRLLCSQKVNLCRDDFLFVKFPLMTNDLDELICCQQVQHCKTLYNSIQ